MKRAELELAIAAATRIVAQDRVLIIGSQAILGSFDEHQLPGRAIESREVDIASLDDDQAESLATRLDALAGEWSEFDQKHGFYIQGVSVRAAYLPDGWMDRLVEVVPPTRPESTGLCLDPHDLCAAKLARNDEKDREFVGALVSAGLVDPGLIAERVELITDRRFLSSQRRIVRELVRSYRRKPRP